MGRTDDPSMQLPRKIEVSYEAGAARHQRKVFQARNRPADVTPALGPRASQLVSHVRSPPPAWAAAQHDPGGQEQRRFSLWVITSTLGAIKAAAEYLLINIPHTREFLRLCRFLAPTF
jgi:hypothetical protein